MLRIGQRKLGKKQKLWRLYKTEDWVKQRHFEKINADDAPKW